MADYDSARARFGNGKGKKTRRRGKPTKRTPAPNAMAIKNANPRARFKREATDTPKRPARPGRTGSSGPAPTPDRERPASGGSGSSTPFARKAAAISARTGGKLPSKIDASRFARRIPAGAKAPVTTAPVGTPKPVPATPGTAGPNARPHGKSGSAPGQRKKVLGLQSARTLAPGASAKVPKPPKAAKIVKMPRGGRG